MSFNINIRKILPQMWWIKWYYYYYYYYYSLIRAFHIIDSDGFHWSLSDSKSPQVSRTVLSILAVSTMLSFGMVSTRPLTSKSSSPFSNPLVTVPNAQITIGIIVTCMFHSFFSSLARSRYLSFFPNSFSFYSVVSRDSKVDYFAISYTFPSESPYRPSRVSSYTPALLICCIRL